MTVFDIRKSLRHPRDNHHYLDNNLFRPLNDDSNSNRVLELHKSGEVAFVLSKSVKVELDDPNTPPEAKVKASGMLFTFPVRPSKDDERKKRLVEAIVVGNSTGTKHFADACHLLEAGLHHAYFVTNDERILRKRVELKAACSVKIVSPAEWLEMFDKPALRVPS